MNILVIAVLMFALVAGALATSGGNGNGVPAQNSVYDYNSTNFQEVHKFQIDSEQANREQGWLWTQNVEVIAKAEIAPGVVKWIEVAKFAFYQDIIWSNAVGAWNETQAWWRQVGASLYDVVMPMQRVFVKPNKAYTRINFEFSPPQVEQGAPEYDAIWHNDAYIEESASITNAVGVEYVTGPLSASGGWIDQLTQQISYSNLILTRKPHELRSYLIYSTVVIDPSDPATNIELIAKFESVAEEPPAVVRHAFDWFETVVDDDTYQRTLNTNTGIEEYLYVPTAQKARDTAETANFSAGLDFTNAAAVKAAVEAVSVRE